MVAGLLLGMASGRAACVELDTVGVRTGMSACKSGNTFYQTDAYANWNLPWLWGGMSGFRIQPRAMLSAGWLHGWHEDGFVAGAGPVLSVGWKQIPVFLEGGFGPSLLSREQYGRTDFGSKLQFTSHGELTWECGAHLSLGYRFQHMSNGGLASSNPGLNLHALAIGWRF